MIINWKLMSHPLNWVIIPLMLIIAAMFGDQLLKFLGVNPVAQQDASINAAGQTTQQI